MNAAQDWGDFLPNFFGGRLLRTLSGSILAWHRSRLGKGKRHYYQVSSVLWLSQGNLNESTGINSLMQPFTVHLLSTGCCLPHSLVTPASPEYLLTQHPSNSAVSLSHRLGYFLNSTRMQLQEKRQPRSLKECQACYSSIKPQST